MRRCRENLVDWRARSYKAESWHKKDIKSRIVTHKQDQNEHSSFNVIRDLEAEGQRILDGKERF